MSLLPSVHAIIATYNEEDVIGVVLKDLLEQGIRVHLLDQGSSDGTLAEAERFRASGRLSIERLEGEDFSLARIIRRKEILATELDADWFINADADEFRESPWPGVGFVDALREVDRLGYNAVDFDVLNFRPIDAMFEKGRDPREVLRFYEHGRAFDRLQIRCWKKQPGPLDLGSTAGHEARFPGRRVFPLRFLLRHYPIRGQKHGERKVFKERLPRFAADERSRGWHVQYDEVKEGQSFLREPSSLTPFDPWGTRVEVALRHREVDVLEEELALRRAEATALQAELRSVCETRRVETDELRGELQRRLAELAQRADALATLRAESAAQAAAANDVRRERDELRRERDNLRGEGDGLRRERDDLRREGDGLRQERDGLRQEGDGLRRERDDLRQEGDGLRRERDDLRQEGDGLRRERDDLRQERDDLRREGDGLRQERDGLRQEGDGLRRERDDLLRKQHEATQALESSVRRHAVLQYRLDSVLGSRIWKWTAPLRALLDRMLDA